MGSDLRFQYTVMGDSVNLASRLEGQTASYGVPLLIGSKTAAAVAEKFALLQVDLVRVKGKAEPEMIYTIAGGDTVRETEDFKALQDQWDRLLVCYRKQDWAGASAIVDQCRPLCARLGLAELANMYQARCDQYGRNPPPRDWDGVFIAQTK